MQEVDYFCDHCDRDFTITLSPSKCPPVDVCPRCLHTMRRVWTAPAIAVKKGKCGNASNGYSS